MSAGKKRVSIIGGNGFQNGLIAETLAREMGIQCDIAEYPVGMLSPSRKGTAKRLFLIDCREIDERGIQSLLGSDGVGPFDLVALFNVPAEEGIEDWCLVNGVRGFFYEQESLSQFLKGIGTLLEGQLWVSREVLTRCLAKNKGRPRRRRDAKRSLLSSREHEVLKEVACGASNKEVAEKLCISVHTVKTHLYNCYQKLGAKNRLEAVSWMSKNSLRHRETWQG